MDTRFFDDEEPGPLSPEIAMQNSPHSTDSETPMRPNKRNSCRPRELDSDQSDAEEGTSESISESIGEIKSLVKMLCEKVDKNDKCLKELQQAQSR